MTGPTVTRSGKTFQVKNLGWLLANVRQSTRPVVRITSDGDGGAFVEVTSDEWTYRTRFASMVICLDFFKSRNRPGRTFEMATIRWD